MRIGILSIAHLHAAGYQANLKAIPGIELVGFSDENSAEGQAFSEEFSVPWFSTHQELLAQRLDGVVICSENARHRELVKLGADAGCQILCEKPIETTLADAEAMKNVCDKNGVRFMTAFPTRFASSTQALRTMVQQGELGKVFGVNGINHSENPSRHRAWFANKELAGGGAAMDHIVHLADFFRWCFSAEIIEVYAEIDNLLYPTELDVDTAGLLLITLSNGIQASIDCSWSRPTWYPRWGHLKIEAIGEKGAAVVDSFSQHLTVYAKSGARNLEWIGFGPDANQPMIQEFVDSIREQREPSVTWNDGYQALRVVLAAYESAQRKEPVKLEHGRGNALA